MNTKYEIQKLISAALAQEFQLEKHAEQIHLEHPADSAHGDWASNVAMSLAKELGMNPREIATKLVERLKTEEGRLESVEVAGPGFINFKLKADVYKSILAEVSSQGREFGKHSIGAGKTVMVEYGQPNTHKAFHVGHLKSAISGLSIVRLYQNLGYKVIQANFYGDVGMHVAKCTWAALQKGLPENIDSMDVHERMKLIDGLYAYGSNQYKDNPESAEQIRSINKEIYANADTASVKMYIKLRDWSLQHLNEVFATLGVHYDRQYPESEFIQESVDIVRKYEGKIFEPSEGAIIYDGKKVGMTSWVFITGEGNPTYEAKDLALAYKKFSEYELDLSIVTTSVEQSERFRVIIHCLELIDEKFKGKYKHVPFGWLLRDNKKTSSRMGESIKGMDVLDESVSEAQTRMSAEKTYTMDEIIDISRKVGISGLRFLILSHEFHKDINYDPEKFLAMEGFSGPYLLYTYTRAVSILRDQTVADQLTDTSGVLNDEAEQAVLKQLAQYPEATLAAGTQNAPHLMCLYVYSLAQSFNQFYAKLSVLNADSEADKQARLLLTKAVAQTLKNGLALLGIETVEKM